MRNQFDVGNAADGGVIQAAQDEHRWRFLALWLDANDDFVALFPLANEINDQFRRILQVGRHGDHGVPTCLQQGMHGRPDVPEVARIDNGLDPQVGAGETANSGYGAIGGGVVDVDVLEIVVR